MSKIVDYLIKGKTDLNTLPYNDGGNAYDYIWGGNGVFVQAENDHIMTRIPLAEFETRGLPAVKALLKWKHGSPDPKLYDFILDEMLQTPELESYYAIVWSDNQYKIVKPQQKVSQDAVKYETLDNVVMEIHSHGHHPSIFSHQDNLDETGFKIYGIFGELQKKVPAACFRIGVYGHFGYIPDFITDRVRCLYV